MYDIGIVTRENESQWGGDLRALYTIRDGLKLKGASVKTGKNTNELKDCRYVFLSNTCLDQTENFQVLKESKQPFGLIGFHEDFLTYFSTMMGFTRAITAIVKHPDSKQVNVEILRNVPEVIGYFAQPPPTIQLLNQHVLRHSHLCVANSEFEERTMLRDCPDARTCAVHWTTGTSDMWKDSSSDDSFLELTGLTSRNYILQVGRLETRKNQLMTLAACDGIGLPIVFIATRGYQPWYTETLKNFSKMLDVDVILVSEEHATQTSGRFKVINMPGGKKLEINTLRSAFEHASVCVGPAFHELPGYTYLEALYLGCPVVSSVWTSCKEYLQYKRGDGNVGGLINYCKPYDINDTRDKIEQQLNRKHKRVKPTNAIFTRTPLDVGSEILDNMTV